MKIKRMNNPLAFFILLASFGVQEACAEVRDELFLKKIKAAKHWSEAFGMDRNIDPDRASRYLRELFSSYSVLDAKDPEQKEIRNEIGRRILGFQAQMSAEFTKADLSREVKSRQRRLKEEIARAKKLQEADLELDRDARIKRKGQDQREIVIRFKEYYRKYKKEFKMKHAQAAQVAADRIRDEIEDMGDQIETDRVRAQLLVVDKISGQKDSMKIHHEAKLKELESHFVKSDPSRRVSLKSVAERMSDAIDESNRQVHFLDDSGVGRADTAIGDFVKGHLTALLRDRDFQLKTYVRLLSKLPDLDQRIRLIKMKMNGNLSDLDVLRLFEAMAVAIGKAEVSSGLKAKAVVMESLFIRHHSSPNRSKFYKAYLKHLSNLENNVLDFDQKQAEGVFRILEARFAVDPGNKKNYIRWLEKFKHKSIAGGQFSDRADESIARIKNGQRFFVDPVAESPLDLLVHKLGTVYGLNSCKGAFKKPKRY